MALFLRDVESAWTLIFVLPLVIAATTWALQMACAFCSVEPPPFWHSLLIVLAAGVSIVVARYFLDSTESVYGIWLDYVAPLIISGVVVALTAPTPLLVGFCISVMHLLFCGMIYFGTVTLVDLLFARGLY